jgi:hypothetical protein
MGMIKEHVRGPIKCCETMASDIVHLTRAEELVHNLAFQSADVGIKQRKQEDSQRGLLPSRVFGESLCLSSCSVWLYVVVSLTNGLWIFLLVYICVYY